jgi:predicted ester cyclase
MNKTITLLMLSILAAAPATAARKEPLRQVMDRFFEAVDSKKPERLATVDAADIEMTTPMGTFRGLDGHKQLTMGFGTAFPNFRHNVSRCLEHGDTIACEGTMTGDHTGPMMMPNGQTVPPTHKHIDFTWGGIATVKDGKVTSVHVYFDTMVMMQQLGLVPAPHVAAK